MEIDQPRMPLLARILSYLTEEMGANLLLDPHWRYAGQITFRSGKRVYFRGSSLDINPHGASEIAKDKDFAAFFMRSIGFPAIEGETFFSNDWAAVIGSSKTSNAAVTYARRVGFPLVVKPNSASQGRGVQIVSDEGDLREALAACFLLDRVILLQRLVHGRDFRVVVLGNEVISAYERVPLGVVGDGENSVEQLISTKLSQLAQQKRPIHDVLNDGRVAARLRKEGLQFDAILEAGRELRLLDAANLSSGGHAIDITDSIHPAVAKTCIDVTREMGLQLAGVDLIIDGDACRNVGDVSIIEVNSSPGLDNYASLGRAQSDRVLDLYRKVLSYLDSDLAR